MSLINQMLKDLEARHAAGAETGSLHAAVRVLPQPHRRNRPLLLVALVMLAGVGSGGWWFGLRQEATAARPSPASARGSEAVALAPQPPLAEPPSPAARVAAPPGSSPAEALAPAHPDRLAQPASVVPRSRSQKTAPRAPGETLALLHPAAPPPTPDTHETHGSSGSTPALAGGAQAAAPDHERGERALGEERTAMGETPAIGKQMRQASAQETAEADFQRGLRLYEEGRAREAEQAWRQALESDPANATSRHALLGLLVARGDREQAMRLVQDGLIADPRQHRLRMILARMQLDNGALNEALRTLEAALSDPMVSADYLATAAAVMARAGRNREAAQLYQRALQQGPVNPVWYMGLGLALRADGRSAEASTAFERARAAKSLAPELQAFVEGQLRELR